MFVCLSPFPLALFLLLFNFAYVCYYFCFPFFLRLVFVAFLYIFHKETSLTTWLKILAVSLPRLPFRNFCEFHGFFFFSVSRVSLEFFLLLFSCSVRLHVRGQSVFFFFSFLLLFYLSSLEECGLTLYLLSFLEVSLLQFLASEVFTNPNPLNINVVSLFLYHENCHAEKRTSNWHILIQQNRLRLQIIARFSMSFI